jgi:hypothetical protein
MTPKRLLTAIAVAISTTIAVAQSSPDFSGHWKLDPALRDARGGGRGAGTGGGGGQGGGLALGPAPEDLVIRRDAASLTIEQRGAIVRKLVYKLDGAEFKIDLPAGPATRSGKAKSRWDGDRLVTTIVAASPRAGGQPVTYEEVRYLADSHLVVETSMTGRDGWRKLVYEKVK